MRGRRREGWWRKDRGSSSPVRDGSTVDSGGGFERRPLGSKPSRARRVSPPPPSSSSFALDADILTEEFGDLRVSPDYRNSNPRSFPHNVKQQCWEKAEKVKGRDPERWRRDALGNAVFRKLVGCPGCLCHDYDHIVPYSKATVNRSKGNKTEISKADLIQKSSYCRVSGRDMDLIELSAYGNVRRGQDSGGCRIQ